MARKPVIRPSPDHILNADVAAPMRIAKFPIHQSTTNSYRDWFHPGAVGTDRQGRVISLVAVTKPEFPGCYYPRPTLGSISIRRNPFLPPREILPSQPVTTAWCAAFRPLS